MSPPPPPPQPSTDDFNHAEEGTVNDDDDSTLHQILRSLLPLLLLASLSVKSFTTKWRGLHDKLAQLSTCLSSLHSSSDAPSHPLFPTLLTSILNTLVSLRSLSRRCNDDEITGGRLLLRSDLDIAVSSLDRNLQDLRLLLPFLLPPSVAKAIVLSDPKPSSSKEDILLFVRDLFARLLIGGVELKKKALDSLVRLLQDCGEAAAAVVTAEGDVSCLVRLLDSSFDQSVGIREQAAAAVAALVAATESSRKVVFEEGALGPLFRLLESGSSSAREHAASAIESITADHNNAWAVAAYGGIGVLIDVCRSGNGRSPVMRAKALGSLRNVVVAGGGGDVKETLVDEGAIQLFVEMLGDDDGGPDSEIRRNAVHCVGIMASGGERFRILILQEGALPKLLRLFRDCCTDHDLLEHVLRALHVLSLSPNAAKTLSCSMSFLSQLADLIGQQQQQQQQQQQCHQHIAVALICNVCPGEEGKRAMAGCMGALVKMMMDLPKPAGSQEMATRALVSLLSVRSNRKEFTKDEKSMTRLVQMLDPKSSDGICKKLPVSVMFALAAGGGGGGGGGGCRKRIVAAGACHHLQRLAESDVPGAKKALQRITGGRLKNLLSSISSWRE